MSETILKITLPQTGKAKVEVLEGKPSAKDLPRIKYGFQTFMDKFYNSNYKKVRAIVDEQNKAIDEKLEKTLKQTEGKVDDIRTARTKDKGAGSKAEQSQPELNLGDSRGVSRTKPSIAKDLEADAEPKSGTAGKDFKLGSSSS